MKITRRYKYIYMFPLTMKERSIFVPPCWALFTRDKFSDIVGLKDIPVVAIIAKICTQFMWRWSHFPNTKDLEFYFALFLK